MESTQHEILRRFRHFLTTFVDDQVRMHALESKHADAAQGNNVHAERIRLMCENNEESLVVMCVVWCCRWRFHGAQVPASVPRAARPRHLCCRRAHGDVQDLRLCSQGRGAARLSGCGGTTSA